MRRARRMLLTLLPAVLGLVLQGCPTHVDDGDLSSYPGPFTVLCRNFSGPYRSQDVQRHIEALDARGMHDAYTAEDPGGTLLYYGNYAKYDSPEATRDLATLKQFIYGDTKQKAFPFARMIPVPRPAEEYYPLAKAQPGALYSLQIAVFYGSQDNGRTRQENAITLARDLRENKKLDAYVHHGPGASVVCVGAFPPSAIETQRRMPSISTDPSDLVQSEVGFEDLARLTKIVDLRARDLQQKYPHMFYNGAERYTWLHRQLNEKDWIYRYKKVFYPSVFVIIPDRKVDSQGRVVIERILE